MSAIPFVCWTGMRYEVSVEAEEFLKSTKGCLAVLGVLGKYRTGKSFILNRVILNDQKIFQTGQTVNACTRGIWMCSKITDFQNDRGETISTLVLDSEGLSSTENASNDKNICALMLLLSSFLIYNSFNNIDETALSQISLMTNLTKDFAEQKTSCVFPSFCWLLRDFVLSLKDAEGKDINSNEYLESVLKPHGESVLKSHEESLIKESDKNAGVDSIRETIRDHFPDRICVTMSRPCQEEEDLRNLNSLSWSKMRSVFVDQVDDFRKLITNKLKYKVIDGSEVSGPMLLMITKSFVDAINNGALPILDDSYKMLTDIKDSESANIAMDLFEKTLHAHHLSKEIGSQESLNIKLQEWKRQAITYFRQKSKDKKSTHGQRLNIQIDQRIENFLESNNSILHLSLHSHIQELSMVSLSDFETQWNRKTIWIKENIGNDVSVLAIWYDNSISQLLSRLSGCVQNQILLASKSSELDNLNDVITKLREELSKFIDIQTQKDEMETKYLFLNNEMQEMQSLMTFQCNQIAESVTLKFEIQEHQARAEDLTSQIAGLQNSVAKNEEKFLQFCETTKSQSSKKLKESKDALEEQLLIHKREMAKFKQHEMETLTTLKETQEKFSKLEDLYKITESELQTTQHLLKSSEQELVKSQNQANKTRNEFNDTKREWETQFTCVKLEKDACKRRCDELQEDAKCAKRLKQENLQLSTQIEAQKKFQLFLEKNKSELDVQVRELRNSKSQLEEMLSTCQHERQMDLVRFQIN